MFNYENFKPNKTDFPSIYLGVVEDNNDPDKTGKVRVRILGLHTDSKGHTETEGIPTDHLPWAIPATPPFEGAVNGLGIFSVPVQGSLLAIFFIGGDHNYPVYFASIAGEPQEKSDTQLGFADPTGKYPEYVGEPDWNRNARNENELIKDIKDDAKETDIKQYKSDGWEEPDSPYDAEYPYNTVIETRDDGVVIELDSTTDAERYHIYHKKSGNYFEISGDGQTVFKSNKHNYEINIEGKNILIKGNKNESIGGDSDIKIEGNKNENIVGNVDTKIEGSNIEFVEGSENVTINNNKQDDIFGSLTINVIGKCSITADNIDIDGASGRDILKGVVQGDCICPYTGYPHMNISKNVKATYK